MKIEIVTALYDIKRGEIDKDRNLENYLNWFEKTLKLNCNMTIYVDKTLENFVNNIRNSDNTKIIIQPIEEIYYFKYIDKVTSILNSDLFKNKMKDLNRVECKNNLYSIIIHNKFKWLKMATEINKFNSDYYIWVDAGLSRFFGAFNYDNIWPNHETLKIDKFLTQTQKNFNNYIDNVNKKDYIWDNTSIFAAGLFGGGKKIINIVDEQIEKIFENYILNGCVNNEQVSMAILYKEMPEIFDLRPNNDGTPIPLFKMIS